MNFAWDFKLFSKIYRGNKANLFEEKVTKCVWADLFFFPFRCTFSLHIWRNIFTSIIENPYFFCLFKTTPPKCIHLSCVRRFLNFFFYYFSFIRVQFEILLTEWMMIFLWFLTIAVVTQNSTTLRNYTNILHKFIIPHSSKPQSKKFIKLFPISCRTKLRTNFVSPFWDGVPKITKTLKTTVWLVFSAKAINSLGMKEKSFFCVMCTQGERKMLERFSIIYRKW